MEGPTPKFFGVGFDFMRRLIGLFIALLWLAGCAPIDRQKLTQEVIAKDPEFGAVLEKHRELSSRIQTYDRELSVRRSEVEKKITQLRKDLVEAAASVRMKTNEAKKRMEPDRLRLQQALTQAGNELKIKQEQRSTLGKQIAMLKKSPGQSPDGNLAQLLKQAEQFDQDLAEVKERTRLYKIKLLLIKL